MTRRPGFPVDEIRGRLLHEALLADARSLVSSHNWDAEPVVNPPEIPMISRTPTGTMRAVVVAI